MQWQGRSRAGSLAMHTERGARCSWSSPSTTPWRPPPPRHAPPPDHPEASYTEAAVATTTSTPAAWTTRQSCTSRPTSSFATLAKRGFPDAPGEIRTPDLRFRRPTLYPAELRAPGRSILASAQRRCGRVEGPTVSASHLTNGRAASSSERTRSTQRRSCSHGSSSCRRDTVSSFIRSRSIRG